MSNGFQVPSTVLNNMSAKARGYLEAAMKLAEALRMKEEAEEELAQLDGRSVKKKTKYHSKPGGRVSAPKAIKRKKKTPSKVSAEDLVARLQKRPMTSGELAKKVGCSDSHVRTLLADSTDVHRVGSGNRVQWAVTGFEVADKSKLSRRSTVANKMSLKSQHRKGFIQPEAKFEEVLKVIKDGDGWSNQVLIQKKTGLSLPVVTRVLKAMKRAQIVKAVTKANNPAHEDSAKNFNKMMKYWVVA